MRNNRATAILAFVICLISISAVMKAQDYQAFKAATAPSIDGDSTDQCWQGATWYNIDQVWLGSPMSAGDFEGRFKLAWDDAYLYVLAEIRDDSLSDDHPNLLENYWEDDCLEIFVDEDHSGGDHQLNYNAFAYHISLSFDVVDLGAGWEVMNFTDHVTTDMDTVDNDLYVWEAAMLIYDDTFVPGALNTPVVLAHSKEIGFSIAYCDNDETTGRENFIGSTYKATSEDVMWQNADYFSTLTLIDPNTYVQPTGMNDWIDIVYDSVNQRLILTMNTRQVLTDGQIDIYNISGQRIYSQRRSDPGNETIYLGTIIPGLYIFSMKAGDLQYRGKFVVPN
jgi:hypothetical protein